MRELKIILFGAVMVLVSFASAQVRDSVPLIIADSLKAVYIYADTGTAINQLDAQGRKTGLWEKRYPNGKVRYRGHFYKDVPHGVFKYWWDNDSIQNIAVYSEEGKVVRTKMFYQNGGLYSIGKLVDRKRDSIFVVYDEFSRLINKEQYNLGKKEGKFITFYPNGNVMEVKTWHDDLENGTWQQFFEDGQLKLEGNYIKGKLQGKFKAYDPGNTDTPVDEGNYTNDVKDGRWIYRNLEKGTSDTAMFRNGKCISKLKNPFTYKNLDSLRMQNQEMQEQLDHPGNGNDDYSPEKYH